jgi:hypothetical protein
MHLAGVKKYLPSSEHNGNERENLDNLVQV